MKFFKKNTACSRSRRGFSLVEVLLALAVLGIAMLSIMGLLNATFESVGRNVMTRQALGVYSALDRAFLATDSILKPDGTSATEQASGSNSSEKKSFDYVYEWTHSKMGKNWNDATFFVCIARRLNPTDDASPQQISQIIYCENAAGTPTQAELTELDSEGAAFFMRVYVSPQLEGRFVEMDSNGEVSAEAYTAGSSLPANAERFALPYLPLTVEIYPFTPGSATTEDQQPVMTQFLVVPR